MAASMYLNDDERFDLPIRFPVGSGESAYSVTGVGSQRVTALQHGSWSQHDTHLEIPPPSEHHANNEPPPVHSHAYSSQGLLLQHADSSGNRLLSANSQHGLQVADANTPGEPVSPSSAPLFSIPNKLQCEQCPVLFNGNDRKSNLARHVRNKHTLANVRTFRCTGCNKVCGRKDALLKHERKCQPGLHSDPVKRKKDKKATATTPSRKANNRFSPRRPPAKMPAPTNVASAPQTPRTHAPTVFATQASFTVPDLQQPPGMGPLALDFSNIHTSAHTDHEPSVANVWGVGNWVPTPSGPSDPAAGEDQAFKQLHYAMQQAVEAVPSHQAADPFLYLGQHGLAPYNAAQQEGWPSPQHLHPPYPAQGYRRPLSPTNHRLMVRIITSRLPKVRLQGIIARLFRILMQALSTVKRMRTY
ncbi:hypothetical protein J4E91_004927 [Alternaria rosae]|nr:hypothetical protein J4E91_004927 [Alternaria rosae]